MYRHGIYGSEVPTSLVPTTQITAGLPVVFGTAPIHLAADAAGANKPVLCYTYAEAVQQLGYSDDWEKYTLCEFMKSHFALFSMAPAVFVNVLDAAKHKEETSNKETPLKDGIAEIDAPVLINTLIVKLSVDGQPLTKNVDYTASYNDEEKVIVTAIESGKIVTDISILFITYEELKPQNIDADDIIGGIDTTTGEMEGLELVNQVYPKLGLIPGLILAPGWSHNSGVAAIMKAKTTNINGHFEAICLCDADTKTAIKYTDVSEWKNKNNFNDCRQVLCWPKVRLAEKQYYLSTQLAGVICKTDAAHEDIPYWSPSNQSLQADGAVIDGGKEIFLDTANAAYLNGQGIVTAINFIGGWRAWGNRTCCYPANTDVKDAFIPIRRMFNYINNTLITTYWSKIDNPTNKRLIDTIVDSANIWLSGLTAREFILGGRVEFREDENTTIDLMDGIMRFHVFIAPPSPAREIEFIQEYDPDYIANLFKQKGR